jgi:DNA polymerase III subunit delta'
VRTEASATPNRIVGHGWVLDLLAKQLAEGRVPHAHLIVGTPSIGKFTTALAMAQLLLCEHRTGCGVCRQCGLAGRLAHPDLRVLEIPSDRKNIPVAEVHEFVHGIALRPLEAERKVYVVRGAEDLAEEGANALLKTIEEPPPAVTIILTAPEPAAVLPTIVSRCQVVRLRPAARGEICAYLEARFSLAPDRADVIARASKGRPGWAVLAAEDPALVDERETRARELLAMLRGTRLDRLERADALAERWGKDADEVRDALDAWMELWRDLLLSQHGAAERIAFVGLAADIAELASALQPETVRHALAATLALATALDRNAHARLALETYGLRLPHVPGRGPAGRVGRG